MTAVSAAERRAITEMARAFARREIEPRIQTLDEAEETPLDLLAEMAELGLFGIVIPTEYGGAGLDYRTYVDAVLEIAKADSTIASFLTFPAGLVGGAILRYGTEEQKQRYLIPLAQGKIFGASAVTEPRSGSDVAGLETSYEIIDGDFVINGAKAWISNVGIANFVLTFATRDRARKHAGIAAFLIPTDTPGLGWHPYKNKLGFKTMAAGDVYLQDVRVPRSSLLGEEGEGFRVAMSAVEQGRLGVATRALGVTYACLEACKVYANERVIFDAPISKLQIVQSKITDMVVGAETSRSLIYNCAEAMESGERVRQLTCMAKMYASDVAQRSATDAVQIHGAYGTSPDYPVSRNYRDAKVLQIVEGSNDLHRALIAEIELGLRSAG